MKEKIKTIVLHAMAHGMGIEDSHFYAMLKLSTEKIEDLLDKNTVELKQENIDLGRYANYLKSLIPKDVSVSEFWRWNKDSVTHNSAGEEIR